MNAQDHSFSADPDLAHLIYGDGDFKVAKPGRYVLCAVSGARIPIEALRYWNPVTQEAYASPKEALARWRELQASGG
ncbi:DUF2093 domain-containing protein [soil metagenome]